MQKVGDMFTARFHIRLWNGFNLEDILVLRRLPELKQRNCDVNGQIMSELEKRIYLYLHNQHIYLILAALLSKTRNVSKGHIWTQNPTLLNLEGIMGGRINGHTGAILNSQCHLWWGRVKKRIKMYMVSLIREWISGGKWCGFLTFWSVNLKCSV